MILKVELENFYSIKEKILIDFRAANYKTKTAQSLSDNVIKSDSGNILKSIGLFGANASGKSNIIKAINFCLHVIVQSQNNNENSIFLFTPFKFDGFTDKPSTFLVDFLCEGIEYEYSYSMTQKEILKESLFYYPHGRRAKIFTRDEAHEGKKYSFAPGVIERPNDVVISTGGQTLFLSRASSMKREIAQRLFQYFSNGIQRTMPASADEEMNRFNQYKDLILKILNISDFDICDIKAEMEEMKAPAFKFDRDYNLELNIANARRVKYITFHRQSPEIPFILKTEESHGTQKLFAVLLNIIKAIKNGQFLLIDELETSFHSRLTDVIIDLIHASKNSQLIFTSHDTNLIDTKRFRRDQIVFVQKKINGATEVFSLFDYKDFRENMNAEKAYLQGKFEAVPFIDSSVGSLKKLLESEDEA